MIRRLIRWLAEDLITHEVASARAEEKLAAADRIEAERKNCTFALKLHEHAGFLRGHHDGVRFAFEEIDKMVRERTGREENPFTEEDVQAAKKGHVH